MFTLFCIEIYFFISLGKYHVSLQRDHLYLSKITFSIVMLAIICHIHPALREWSYRASGKSTFLSLNIKSYFINTYLVRFNTIIKEVKILIHFFLFRQLLTYDSPHTVKKMIDI